jgi:pyridoxine/pyridoxamine 5'-phosphate oxidase
MANRMVYCTLATVDRCGRPRSRIVHMLWRCDGPSLVGIV